MPDPDGRTSPPDLVTLDLRGLKCPLPVLRTRRALARATAGARVEVRCTDPLAGLDIPNLVRETGDVLLASEQLGCDTRFVILKSVCRTGVPAGPHEDPSVPADVDSDR